MLPLQGSATEGMGSGEITRPVGPQAWWGGARRRGRPGGGTSKREETRHESHHVRINSPLLALCHYSTEAAATFP